MRDFLLISTGAVVGANLRYWVATYLARRMGDAFPYGTLAVNVSGSFLIGFVLAFLSTRQVTDPSYRLLIGTGFLGAYTTFSAFSYETISLLQRGEWGSALLNSAANLLGSLLAAFLGIVLAQVLS